MESFNDHLVDEMLIPQLNEVFKKVCHEERPDLMEGLLSKDPENYHMLRLNFDNLFAIGHSLNDQKRFTEASIFFDLIQEIHVVVREFLASYGYDCEGLIYPPW